MNRQATVRRRLREVIDAVFDGNVKAAAAAAGVAQPTLHKIVSGDVAESKGSTIERLADAFGIPVAWLRGEVELLPDETVGGRGPRWLNLIRLYTVRAQHKDREWLKSVTGLESHPIFATLTWIDEDQDSDFYKTIDACVDQALAREGRLPESHKPAVRALFEAETQVLRLAANELRRVHAGDSARTPARVLEGVHPGSLEPDQDSDRT